MANVSRGRLKNIRVRRWDFSGVDYNRFADLPVIRWFVPEDLSIANAELMPLSQELAAMEDQLRTLPIPVTVMQGMKDGLVAPANADYVEATMKSARLRVMRFPETGHFLIWEKPGVVTDEILRLAREKPTVLQQ